MRFSDLSFDEVVVFVALVRHLVRIDDLFSMPEMVLVRGIQGELGPVWPEATRAATLRCATLQDAVEAARSVTRQEARAFITEQLERVAESDGTCEREQRMLNLVHSVWHDDVL